MENKHLIDVTEAGLGRPENPYDFYSTIIYNNTGLNAYQQFEANNPIRPAYQQDGKTPLEAGKWECELVWQYRGHSGIWIPISGGKMLDYYKSTDIETRQIYRLLPPLSAKTDEVKEVLSQDTLRGYIDGYNNGNLSLADIQLAIKLQLGMPDSISKETIKYKIEKDDTRI